MSEKEEMRIIAARAKKFTGSNNAFVHLEINNNTQEQVNVMSGDRVTTMFYLYVTFDAIAKKIGVDTDEAIRQIKKSIEEGKLYS